MEAEPLADGRQSQEFVLRSGCKINLYLKIYGRRPDGYHELESVFLPLPEPFDTLTVEISPEPSPSKGLQVSCTTPGIDPADNTLTKTYEAYAKATGFRPDLRVTINKGVPHGAGLGGGSANSAVFLQFLQDIARKRGYPALDSTACAELAAGIGADVPFFLLNRPALVRGIGERLREVENPCTGMRLVLVCPDVQIATSWAFKQLDALREPDNIQESPKPAAGREIKTRKSGADGLTAAHLKDTTPISHGLYLENDFEEVVFPAFPSLFQVWKTLREAGALSARLSGTGSSLFGLFRSGESAAHAAERLSGKGFQVYTRVL